MTRPEMVSSRSLPPWAAGGILLNSTEGPVVPCLEWQAPSRRENRRRNSVFRSKSEESLVFSQRNGQKQARLRQRVERDNSILGDAVCSVS